MTHHTLIRFPYNGTQVHTQKDFVPTVGEYLMTPLNGKYASVPYLYLMLLQPCIYNQEWIALNFQDELPSCSSNIFGKAMIGIVFGMHTKTVKDVNDWLENLLLSKTSCQVHNDLVSFKQIWYSMDHTNSVHKDLQYAVEIALKDKY